MDFLLIDDRMTALTLPSSSGRVPASAHRAWSLLLAAGLTALAGPSRADSPQTLMLQAGSSRVVTLPQAVERVSVAHPGVLDVVLTSQRELYVLGRGVGWSNIMLWSRGAPVSVIDVQVEMDVRNLRSQLQALLPQETELQVQPAADSVVLWGTVSSVVQAEQAMALAQGHVRAMARLAQPTAATAPPGAAPTAAQAGSSLGGSPPHVINLLKIRQPQQVMLEVKVVEVSRNLLDQFGVSLNLSRASGSMTYGLVTQALQDVFGRLTIQGRSGTLSVDAKAQDGLLKVLAEPNIVALSGQEGSFLAGGRVFIPVARDSAEGRATVTLEEKEYGVGLRFTPQVLEGDVVQLRVAPEVSELTRTGSPFLSSGGVTTVLPSFTTRRASTTVQLRDGQSLAIAGLIKNINTETLSKFPFLGDLPILGALFRSNEFQQDRSEVLFIITPRLVKALPALAGPSGDDEAANAQARAAARALTEDPEWARRAQTLNPQAGQDRHVPDTVQARDAMSVRRPAAAGGGAAGSSADPGPLTAPPPTTPSPR
ncbi:MAG: type II and III secretion system protein family protein [Betaproteobacteria bacterium]|nr:type II and III secretion system protein family protein [Betaproteobacteria bacterium]NBT11009.1 type II and III secretion system protein family protein [Betaproteobacteria bacterium]NBU50380.1 type II and III secretion system protein family protein [Betaproteobacteria bacterium]